MAGAPPYWLLVKRPRACARPVARATFTPDRLGVGRGGQACETVNSLGVRLRCRFHLLGLELALETGEERKRAILLVPPP